MANIQNLFKHNIFFTSVNEDRISFVSNDNFSISVVYISKNIMWREKNINQLGDLLDQIDPFLYYLASKYQKSKETISMRLFSK